MSAGDLLKADETKAATTEEADSVKKADARPGSATDPAAESLEAREDDAWLDACREETDAGLGPETPVRNKISDAEEEAAVAGEDVKDFSDGVAALSADLEKLRRRNDDTEIDAAIADLAKRIAAMEKTGTEAMGTLSQAMNVIADRVDELDEIKDRAEHDAFASAVERAIPSEARDDVAPYIENAERELQAAKEAGPVDIFDRIAQAAESQFDETRGSTAQRVSKLVDDRRVGTKRWTPSKTVKARMAKLEAARLAAAESADAAVATEAAVADAVDAVDPAVTEQAEVQIPAPEERVVISRKERQPAVEDSVSDEPLMEDTATDDETPVEDDDEDVALRIIPGARGRRRDRARKSRLDEDFEKIFEDDDKPSIGSLRRKLRSGAQRAAEEAEAQDGASARVTEETYGAEATVAEPEAKAGFLAKLLKRKPKPAAAKPAAAKPAKSDTKDDDTDALVAAFESDENDPFVAMDDSPIENGEWDDAAEDQRRQRQISTPIIIATIAIVAGGAGYVLYKTLLGG